MTHIYANERITRGYVCHREEGYYEEGTDPDFRTRDLVHHQTSLIRRELARGVYFPPKVKYREDLIYYALITERVKNVKMLDYPWYIWRNNLASVSHSRLYEDQKNLEYWIDGFMWGLRKLLLTK